MAQRSVFAFALISAEYTRRDSSLPDLARLDKGQSNLGHARYDCAVLSDMQVGQ